MSQSEPPSPGLVVPIGLVDDPSLQTQETWWLDFSRAGGHVAVIGAPQSGRTTLLRTLAVSAALGQPPGQVSIYGIDLSGGGLSRIARFPHVGGVATRAQRERASARISSWAVRRRSGSPATRAARASARRSA